MRDHLIHGQIDQEFNPFEMIKFKKKILKYYEQIENQSEFFRIFFKCFYFKQK